MSESVKATNRDLFKMFMALKTLGGRRMATVGADLKVARLLRVLAPLVEPLDELKQRVVKEALEDAPKDAAGVTMSLLNIRVSEAQNAIDGEAVDVDLPLQFALKEADLPKRKKDEDADDANSTGLGALVADLGVLFTMADD